MFGYPCILKIELYNSLIISMLFSSDEVVHDGIGRCHTLWFCARLLSHFPSLLPSLLHSELTETLLTLSYFPNFSFMGCVLGPFQLLSLHKVGSQG